MVLAPQDCARLVARGLYSNPRNLGHFLTYMFGANTGYQKNVLDIGGGGGVLCLAACLDGAVSGDCVDPEGAGSTAGSTGSFEETATLFGLPQARMIRQTFQAFEGPDDHYDLVFIDNAINHLDEAACIELQTSEAARAAYVAIFSQLRAMLRPNARVIISDCGRKNAFGDRSLKSPLMPTIEWNKHQQPEYWATVIEPTGFKCVRIQWSSFHTLGRPGRLLGNESLAYFLLSHFRMELVAV